MKTNNDRVTTLESNAHDEMAGIVETPISIVAKPLTDPENYATSLPIIPKPLQLWGYVEEVDGIYAHYTKKDLEPISNFTLKIVEQTIGDNSVTYDIDILLQEGPIVRQQFSYQELCKLAKFKDRLSQLGMPLSFQGKQKDLDEICLMILSETFEKKQGVDHIGIMWVGDEAVFLSQDRCIKGDGTEYTRFAVADDAIDVRTDLLDYEPITAAELSEIIQPLFGYNSLPITATILGYIGSCFLRPLLNKIGIKHGSLLAIGESGGGKSTTLDEVIRPILGCGTPMSAADFTEASLRLGISSSNAIPFIIEEYKPAKLSRENNKSICNTLRNNYDQTLSRKCRSDSKVVEKVLRAPIILVGESQPPETAIRERCLQVLFSRDELEAHPEYNKCLTALRCRPKLLHKLGRSMLQLALNVDLDTLKIWHTDLMTDAAISLGDWTMRVRNSYVNGMLGILLLDCVCQNINESLETMTGIVWEEFCNALQVAIQEYLLQGQNHNRSIIEEGLAVMFGRMNLVAGTDYKYLNEGTEIAINLNGVYDSFRSFVERNNQGNQIEQLPQEQFEQQLKKKKFFKESRTVSMCGKKKRCLILDTNTLSELIGEDLPEYLGSKKKTAA